MSIKKNGVSTGKRGNTVTYLLNGQEVERSIGMRVKPFTVPELINQTMLSHTNILLQPAKQFVKSGFELQGKMNHTYAYSMAVGYNKKNAIKVKYPDAEILYAEALFSQGEMPLNPETVVSVVEGGLEFRWDPALLKKGMKRDDHAMLLACCPEKESAFFELSGARRTAGKDILEITAYHQPVILEVYITFVAANRNSISNSFYIGQKKF